MHLGRNLGRQKKIENFSKFSFTGKAEEALDKIDYIRYEMREVMEFDLEEVEPEEKLTKIEKNFEKIFRYLLLEEGSRAGKISSEKRILIRSTWEDQDIDWDKSKEAFRKFIVDEEKVLDRSGVDLKEFTAHYMQADRTSYDRNRSRSPSGARGRTTSPST